MFYLAKIAADDRIARNFDFEPIPYEKIKNFFFSPDWLCNRYPLYYGPEIEGISKYSLKRLFKHYADITETVKQSIFDCILEMVFSGYFEKTNIVSTDKLSRKEKLLFAHYIFGSSKFYNEQHWLGEWYGINGQSWHIDKGNILTTPYHWLVSLGNISTMYDTRFRIVKFSRPSTENVRFMPVGRVIGMHSSIIHQAPDIPIESRKSKKRLFFLLQWMYRGAGHVSFNSWKKRYTSEKLQRFMNSETLLNI